MNIGICKFCGNEKELIRAHIIPESLYPADENGNRMQFVLDGRGERPKSKLQNGEFDTDLVCRECEDLFNTGDNYAKQLLVDRRSEVRAKKTEQGATYFEYTDVNYKSLKLFFISLLWRAHASSRRNFDQVDIGAKHEADIRRMIREGDPGLPDDFAVVMLRAKSGPLDKMGAAPTPRRMPDSIRVYEFLLFGYIAYVKVDQRPYGYQFINGQLTSGMPLLMLEIPIEETPFFRFAKDAYSMAVATQDQLRSSNSRRAQ